MDRDATSQLINALAAVDDRCAASARLAAHLGGDALYIFTPHPDHPATLIPAAGCHPTVPSSRGWRELLARCSEPGEHVGEVAYPSRDDTARATALAYPGIAFVLVGASHDATGLRDALATSAPLLAALLRVEADAITHRSALALAHGSVERSAVLAQALDAARDEAVQATLVKDEFLAMLGHELRNPLSPIVTALQLMRLDGVHNPAQDILERQVDHMMRLVDDLLDVSRITRGKVELRRERLEVHAAVRGAIELTSPLLDQRRNELVVDVPATGLAVDGDPARLTQVISNLLTNATRHSEPGTPIRIAAEQAGDWIRVAVADQGVGIEPVQLERVFDRFVQLARHRPPQPGHRGGLGLGLTIVRSLVAMHGGSVTAHSEGRGKGSTFVVELPAAAGSPPLPRATSGLRAVRPTGTSVLVVDDSQDAADLLGGLLRKLGYTVRIAYTGPEALEALADFTPDAALLDIGLPVMDGYELARRMRQAVPDTRLVAITGYSQPGDRARTKEAGFDAHLVKPVRAEYVRKTIDELLEPVD